MLDNATVPTNKRVSARIIFYLRSFC